MTTKVKDMEMICELVLESLRHPQLFKLISIKGTVTGALDESFSNESQLEIWAPDFLDKNKYDLGGDSGEGHAEPKDVVADNSRCVCALNNHGFQSLTLPLQIQSYCLGTF
jgi:hypothetical protein